VWVLKLHRCGIITSQTHRAISTCIASAAAFTPLGVTRIAARPLIACIHVYRACRAHACRPLGCIPHLSRNRCCPRPREYTIAILLRHVRPSYVDSLHARASCPELAGG
jgi:hypothetical protein